MKPHEVKFAVVSQLWRDHITVGTQHADIDTVARYVSADGGTVREEVTDWMLPNEDCPLVKMSHKSVALVDDAGEVAEYLNRHAGDDDELPGDLRDL